MVMVLVVVSAVAVAMVVAVMVVVKGRLSYCAHLVRRVGVCLRFKQRGH